MGGPGRLEGGAIDAVEGDADGLGAGDELRVALEAASPGSSAKSSSGAWTRQRRAVARDEPALVAPDLALRYGIDGRW